MSIVRAAENAVRSILENLPKDFVFHDYSHCKQVQDAVIVIGRMEGLNAESLEILQVAALFHDTGYDLGSVGHELRGAEKAKEFLKAEGATAYIPIVKELILATQVDKAPDSLMAQVLCDADLSYLGTDLYYPRASLLRHEMFSSRNRSFTEIEWLNFNLEFFKKHHYLTSSARVLFGPKKDFNQLELDTQLSILEVESTE